MNMVCVFKVSTCEVTVLVHVWSRMCVLVLCAVQAGMSSICTAVLCLYIDHPVDSIGYIW